MTNFDLAYKFTSKWEGGYVNDPADPGGETKFGISKRSYPHLDIKNLTPEEAKEIFRQDYWDVMNCDNYHRSMGIALFDTAVLCGPNRARNWARKSQNYREFLEQRMAFHLSSKNKRFVKGWVNRVNDLKKYIDILEYQ